MQVFDGEYSGFEFILLPSDQGDFVVFQIPRARHQITLVRGQSIWQ